MARKEKKYHYIYKTTCSVTGRYYIGMHSTDNLNDGYLGSGKRLWNSIKYHGKENHSIEILEHHGNREDLRNREAELVNEELLKDTMCMNLGLGGGGGIQNDEHGKKFHSAGGKVSGKIRANRVIIDTEFRTKITNQLLVGNKSNNYDHKSFLNKTHTNETKVLMGEKKIGVGLGNSNSQFGTCWITKNGVNKKIKKDDLETHLNDGWSKGRK